MISPRELIARLLENEVLKWTYIVCNFVGFIMGFYVFCMAPSAPPSAHLNVYWHSPIMWIAYITPAFWAFPATIGLYSHIIGPFVAWIFTAGGAH